MLDVQTSSPLRRILSRAVLVAGLSCMVAACTSEITSSVPERDANEMTSILAQSGIDATRQRQKNGQFSLSVDASKAAEAMAVLAKHGLPRQQLETFGSIFDSKRVVSTPLEERARFMYALNQELANSLTQIAGVISARVHVMLPEADPLERDKPAPRAAVFIYHVPEASMNQYAPVIKNLVVNAVAGLNYEDVALAFFPARTAATPAAPIGDSQTVNYVLLGLSLSLAVALLATFGRSTGRHTSRA